MEKMDTKTLPALRGSYESAVAALETERAQRLQQTIAGNATVSAKWDAKIAEGAMFTRWFNIGVNLLRVLLIVGYAIFLLDVYQDEEEKIEHIAKVAPGMSSYMAVSNPPAATESRNTPERVSNSSQPIDMNGVAAQLEKEKSKRNAYKSKIHKGVGVKETNDAGLARALYEIERLSGILAGQKGL